MLQMIHAAAEHSANMMIPLHSILPLFVSYINRKRGIKHCEERPAFITFATLLYMDENRRNRRYLGIAMGTMLRQKGFLC